MEDKQNSINNSGKTWLVGLGILAVVVVFMVVNSKNKDLAEVSPNSQESAMEEKDSTMKQEETTQVEPGMVKEETMQKEEGSTEEKDAIMQKQPGAYVDYSKEALAQATSEGGRAVLFFWAAWCPFCKEANTDFLNNLGQIPKGVTVLKVNYDTEKELKTKYGVTYQHTFVQVDVQGNLITKWNGGGVETLKAQIK